jgi:hypothetical protein
MLFAAYIPIIVLHMIWLPLTALGRLDGADLSSQILSLDAPAESLIPNDSAAKDYVSSPISGVSFPVTPVPPESPKDTEIDEESGEQRQPQTASRPAGSGQTTEVMERAL